MFSYYIRKRENKQTNKIQKRHRYSNTCQNSTLLETDDQVISLQIDIALKFNFTITRIYFDYI